MHSWKTANHLAAAVNSPLTQRGLMSRNKGFKKLWACQSNLENRHGACAKPQSRSSRQVAEIVRTPALERNTEASRVGLCQSAMWIEWWDIGDQLKWFKIRKISWRVKDDGVRPLKEHIEITISSVKHQSFHQPQFLSESAVCLRSETLSLVQNMV